MNAYSPLEVLRTDQGVAECLDWPFDFRVRVAGHEEASTVVRILGGQPHVVVATDGTGGVFALCGDQPGPPVLHVRSEGQAGIVGTTLAQWRSILISLPRWTDLLKYSGGGLLQEMRRVLPHVQDELEEEEPGIASMQAFLRQRLGVPELPDCVGVLHANIEHLSASWVDLSGADDGYTPLFNRFVLEANPRWAAG